MIEMDLHVAGCRVFGDIVERFLTDAVNRHLHIRRQNTLSHHSYFGWDVCAPRERIPQ